jgi:hypothetical protein
MNPHRGLWVTGLVLHLLIGGLMLALGSATVFGLLPEDAKQETAGSGIGENLLLIGSREMALPCC